ncbi:TraB/GumN family protein [Paracoccus tegillarcae]|uniref:TraB/GumN family protein n=1 Tax=Paracoccus tegillarcae TaxID=1529068 RepID=A0A2K9EKB0_9RHOB|nr:TraB/GumN family protein [Paracoccus tegillarcae]AUH34839.1 TraB/GumN family protein [Paracoccus tegillarcae]
MRLVIAALSATVVWSVPASAQTSASDCVGNNLIDALPSETRAHLRNAVEDVPYHRGLLWRATKDDQHMTLIGTYHFPDPRHDATMARLQAPLRDAALVMVEAGPDEEARLAEALAEDPSLTVITDGPTLPERLTTQEWQALSEAMAERGTPAVITSKLRPWFVSMMLGISPCMLRGINADGGVHGLDSMLIERADAMDVPVRALEPWDTVFSLFGDLTAEQEEDMIRATLPAAQYADNYAVTLTEAYFDADVWTIWEFGRFDAYENSGLSKAEVDEQMALTQTMLMDARNESWIAPLEQAAAEAAEQGRGVVAGFGALHLPGERGVLRLLQQNGWTIERLDE